LQCPPVVVNRARVYGCTRVYARQKGCSERGYVRTIWRFHSRSAARRSRIRAPRARVLSFAFSLFHFSLSYCNSSAPCSSNYYYEPRGRLDLSALKELRQRHGPSHSGVRVVDLRLTAM